MKKLVMAVAIVCAAALAQAASVTWQSGNVFIPSDDKGTYKTGKDYKLADAATAAMYLWAIDSEAAFNKVVSDGVWATYGGKLASADKSTTIHSNGAFSDLVTTDYDAKETAYAAIIITYTDSNNKVWYLENTAAVTISDLGADSGLGGLGRYIGGEGGTQFSSWGTESVPEPTSGVLMLLGLAGLALKRKRA